MKAMVRHRYGSPGILQLEELRKPTAGDDELLIRVQAVSLNLGDWELLTGKPLFIAVLATLFAPGTRYDPVPPTDEGAVASRPTGGGLFRPKHKILGTDVAGRVEAVGKKVTQFQPGDEVFGMCMFGALAEYVCVPESAGFVKKPAGMSFEEAAAIPQAAFIALQGLRDREQAQPGRKVLINGGGGGAGTLAVQFARFLGAEVTAVDNSLKLEMMRSIGADHVIDYTQEDYTRSGRQYDLILDLAAHRSIFDGLRALRRGGIYLLAGGAFLPTLQAALLGPLLSRLGSKKVVFLLADTNREDLERMTEFYQTGEVVPVVDRTYSLSEAAEAFQLIGEGGAKGKVVITV